MISTEHTLSLALSFCYTKLLSQLEKKAKPMSSQETQASNYKCTFLHSLFPISSIGHPINFQKSGLKIGRKPLHRRYTDHDVDSFLRSPQYIFLHVGHIVLLT